MRTNLFLLPLYFGISLGNLGFLDQEELGKKFASFMTKIEPIRQVYKLTLISILTSKWKDNEYPIGYSEPSSKRVDSKIEKELRDAISPPASLEELQTYGLILASNTCSDLSALKQWKCPVHCEGLVKNSKAHHINFVEGSGFRYNIVSLSDKKIITLGIRGSGKLDKVAESFRGIHPHNIKQTTLPWHTLKEDIRIHIPYYESSKNITAQASKVIKELMAKKEYKDYKLVVLGHSLGGALAPFVALDLKDILNLPKSEIELHVFDTPRVGNIVFANLVNYHFDKLTRVTHGYDPIPRTLLRTAHYCHFSNELYYPPIEYFDTENNSPALPKNRHKYSPVKIDKELLDSISDPEDNNLPLNLPRRGRENPAFTSTPIYCDTNPPYDLEDPKCIEGTTANFNFTSHTYAPTVTYEDTCGGPHSVIIPIFKELLSEFAGFDIPFLFHNELKEELLQLTNTTYAKPLKKKKGP